MHLRTFDFNLNPIIEIITEATTNQMLAKDEFNNNKNEGTRNELNRANFDLSVFQGLKSGVFDAISESRSKDNGVIYEKASQIANVKRIQP
jgi:hypothetical protein